MRIQSHLQFGNGKASGTIVAMSATCGMSGSKFRQFTPSSDDRSLPFPPLKPVPGFSRSLFQQFKSVLGHYLNKGVVHVVSILILALLSVPNIADADTEFIDSGTFTPTGSPANNYGLGVGGKLGFRYFNGAQDVSVTQLGAWVVAGSTETHTLSIYDESGCTLLGSVTLNFNGLSVGPHYATLSSPVTVPANSHAYFFVNAVEGGDSFYASQPITHTAIGTVPESGFNNCQNSGNGADTAHGPVFFQYTVGGGGGGCTGCAPTNFTRIDNEFFAGNNLPVTLGWVNTDTNAAIAVYYNTNVGGAFSIYESKNAGATNSSAIQIPANQVWSFCASYDGINFSETNSIWGEQKITNFRLNVLATNSVLFQFTDVASTDGDGVLIWQATNSTFTGNTSWITVPKTNSNLYIFTYNFSPIFNQRYWWKAYATNTAGYQTGPSDSINSAPFSLPNPPSYFNAYNPGVTVRWDDDLSSLVEKWFIQSSVGDTNSLATFYNTVGGSSSYQITDASHSPGDVVYYRCVSSNSVGLNYSAILKVVIPQNVGGTVRWIDLAATGNNTGTNRANAYPNFASINWANTDPGTLFWIAPGNYDEVVNVGASGTSNAPVVLKVITNEVGKVRLRAIINQSHPWVWWDGAKADYPDAYLNARYTVLRLSGMTNNIGLQLLGETNLTFGVINIATGFKAKWIEVTGDYKNLSEFGEGSVGGFKISGGVAGDTEVSWCWIHDMTADDRSGSEGIAGTPDSGGSAFDTEIFHHLIIERIRDNFIGVGGGITVHDCVFRDSAGGNITAGHPDGLQCGGGWWKIYNNIFQNHNGTSLYVELVTTNTQDLYIFNNLIYGTTDPGKPHDGITFSTEHNQAFIIPTMSVSNFCIANNLFFGFSGGYISGTLRLSQATQLVFTNGTVANNISFALVPGETFGFGFTIDNNGTGIGSSTNISPEGVRFDWNDVTGMDTNIGWNSSNYTVAQFGTSIGFTNNFTYIPEFTATNIFQFYLTSHDSTNAVGTNLNNFAGIVPTVSRTMDGYLRTKLGWQTGPLSLNVDSNLICWPTFEGYDRTSDVLDATPWLNDATLPGTVNTNWPTATNCPGNFAGAFFGGFQYLAITNVAQMMNMTNLTICLRGGIGGGSIGDAVFLDAGSLNTATNGWAFGRDNSTGLRFWVNRDDGIQTNLCPFSDVIGTPTGFHFWAIALSCSGSNLTGINYLDGVPVVTNTVSHCSRMTIAEDFLWLAVGKRKHNHSPDPNVSPDTPNGFIVNPMADIRIYNRTLNNDEVMAVFLGQGTGGGGGSAPTISSFTATPGTITVGDSSVLSWSTSGETSLSIDQGVGDVTGLTQTTVSPPSTTTYTLTASNGNGDNQAQTTITVNPDNSGRKVRIRRRP